MDKSIPKARRHLRDSLAILNEIDGELEFYSSEFRIAAYAAIQAVSELTEENKFERIHQDILNFRGVLSHMYKPDKRVTKESFLEFVCLFSQELDRLEGDICTTDQCTDRQENQSDTEITTKYR